MHSAMTQVRVAQPSDQQAITQIITAAFNLQSEEILQLIGDLLVDPSARPLLSLVADVQGRVVGHILFSNAKIAHSALVNARILAPLAIHPDFQAQGIGRQLIAAGLAQLAQCQVDLVFVLGHPGYYAKHGFAPATRLGFAASYRILPEQEDAWMVQALRPGIIGQVHGKVLCADALNYPHYWVE